MENQFTDSQTHGNTMKGCRMTIFVEDSFDSAHFLPNVPEGHKCRNLHGHTYRIRIEVKGDVDPQMEWVIDYGDVKAAWNPIKAQVDHVCLNYISDLPYTTCERLSEWIYKKLKASLPGLFSIELRETASCGVVCQG